MKPIRTHRIWDEPDINLVIDREPSWLSLDFESSKAWILTVGSICLLLLEQIFSNDIIGVVAEFGDFGFPGTGVKVQDPESKKTLHDQLCTCFI